MSRNLQRMNAYFVRKVRTTIGISSTLTKIDHLGSGATTLGGAGSLYAEIYTTLANAILGGKTHAGYAATAPNWPIAAPPLTRGSTLRGRKRIGLA